MPLRPALATIHPREPAPRSMRRVLCPHCGRAFEVSTRAMSVRCPACTRPLEFKDLTLRARMEGDVSTMGHVELTNHSEMIGRLVYCLAEYQACSASGGFGICPCIEEVTETYWVDPCDPTQ